MRRPVGLGLALGFLLLATAGCSATQEAPPAREVWPKPPSDSVLAQIRQGMTQQEVMQILGPPTEITNRSSAVPQPQTGETRTYFVYPSLGEVVFSAAAGGATSAVGVYAY